jgi:hypothetical protein
MSLPRHPDSNIIELMGQQLKTSLLAILTLMEVVITKAPSLHLLTPPKPFSPKDTYHSLPHTIPV